MISLPQQRLDDNVYFHDEIYLLLRVEISKFSPVRVIFDILYTHRFSLKARSVSSFQIQEPIQVCQEPSMLWAGIRPWAEWPTGHVNSLRNWGTILQESIGEAAGRHRTNYLKQNLSPSGYCSSSSSSLLLLYPDSLLPVSSRTLYSIYLLAPIPLLAAFPRFHLILYGILLPVLIVMELEWSEFIL